MLEKGVVSGPLQVMGCDCRKRVTLYDVRVISHDARVIFHVALNVVFVTEWLGSSAIP